MNVMKIHAITTPLVSTHQEIFLVVAILGLLAMVFCVQVLFSLLPLPPPK
jgi:hypothetical protein